MHHFVFKAVGCGQSYIVLLKDSAIVYVVVGDRHHVHSAQPSCLVDAFVCNVKAQKTLMEKNIKVAFFAAWYWCSV